jgi:hypothetical protein
VEIEVDILAECNVDPIRATFSQVSRRMQLVKAGLHLHDNDNLIPTKQYTHYISAMKTNFFNAICRNDGCLMRESYETLKMRSVWKILMVVMRVVHTATIGIGKLIF